MNQLHYAIEINQLDATELCQRIDEESLEEFHERFDSSRDQSIFQITIMDYAVPEKAQAFTLGSPYFATKDEQAKWNVLAQAVKAVKRIIVDRERKKVQE